MMKKPGFWQLIGAYVIDFVITSFIVWGCWSLLVHSIGEGSSSYTFSQLDKLFTFPQQCGIYIFLVLAPNILYFAGCECIWKKTIGKWLLGVNVLARNQRLFVEKLSVAYGIDLLLLVPVSMLCILIHILLSGWNCWGCGMSVFDWSVVAGFLSMIVLYFPICESRWGKTLGKKLMGLQVVQEIPAKTK